MTGISPNIWGSHVNKVLNSRPPRWFWPVNLIALLWSGVGLLAWLARGAPESLPLWATITFTIAIVASLLGCVGLLSRRMWARPLLVVALLALAVETAGILSGSEAFAAAPLPSAWTIAGTAVALLLVRLSSTGIRRGWLR